MTPYQSIKNGRTILISAYQEGTETYDPALFYIKNNAVTSLSPGNGEISGYMDGRQFNRHINYMIAGGFAVTTWTKHEQAARAYDIERIAAREARRNPQPLTI